MRSSDALTAATKMLLAETIPASSRMTRVGTRNGFPSDQNRYLSANCMMRGLAAAENDVIFPNVVAELRFTPGLPGMNQLNALNASTRASTLCAPDSENWRTSERSTVLKPGPS